MKYTIFGFQQQKLIDEGLDVNDALILSTIKDLYASKKMQSIIEGEEKHIWINYTFLLEQIPIVGKKRNLMNKLNMYQEKGLLVRVLKNNKNGMAGSFSYVAITEKLDSLTEYDNEEPYAKLAQGYAKLAQGGVQNLHNKDTPIINNSIKDNNTIYSQPKEKTLSPIGSNILSLWNSKNIVTHKDSNKTLVKTLNSITAKEKEICTAIERYSIALNDKTFYYNHIWTLQNFIKQSNGYTQWLDDGQLWLNYNKKGGDKKIDDELMAKIKYACRDLSSDYE